MDYVYIVTLHLPDGASLPTLAFATREAAAKHAARITKEDSDDQGNVLMSVAGILGVSAVTIREMVVHKEPYPSTHIGDYY